MFGRIYSFGFFLLAALGFLFQRHYLASSLREYKTAKAYLESDGISVLALHQTRVVGYSLDALPESQLVSDSLDYSSNGKTNLLGHVSYLSESQSHKEACFLTNQAFVYGESMDVLLQKQNAAFGKTGDLNQAPSGIPSATAQMQHFTLQKIDIPKNLVAYFDGYRLSGSQVTYQPLQLMDGSEWQRDGLLQSDRSVVVTGPSGRVHGSSFAYRIGPGDLQLWGPVSGQFLPVVMAPKVLALPKECRWL